MTVHYLCLRGSRLLSDHAEYQATTPPPPKKKKKLTKSYNPCTFTTNFQSPYPLVIHTN